VGEVHGYGAGYAREALASRAIAFLRLLAAPHADGMQRNQFRMPLSLLMMIRQIRADTSRLSLSRQSGPLQIIPDG